MGELRVVDGSPDDRRQPVRLSGVTPNRATITSMHAAGCHPSSRRRIGHRGPIGHKSMGIVGSWTNDGSMSEVDRDVPHRGRRLGSSRTCAAAWPGPASRTRSTATGWEAGMPIDYLRDLVEYWTRHVRLAGAGEPAERVRSLPHPHRRAVDPLHPLPDRLTRTPSRCSSPTAGRARSSSSSTSSPDSPILRRIGGRAEDAFHVVAPSLPGYGFSEPPRTRGWDVRRIAQAFIDLMDRLGYAALRGAGRRLGCPGDEQDRRARSRALRRHPSQHAGRRPSGRPRCAHRRGAGGPGRHGAVPTPGVRLRQRAGDQAPDRGRRPQRLAGGAPRLDRREVPHVERL